ncbi:MAG TPA: NAD(P)(+) transhydrogenase (Re/Si-specific) subunit beta [Thermodesulfobacteriota bacterium]|nr:NAD(P)(+) transhydrogenase (Re/Si-specific) subunit beta [Thermodesulfobacteriota bacterium]
MTSLFTNVIYLISAVLFILGLKGLNSPETARKGQRYAALGMAMAIIGTLVQQNVVSYEWIIVGMIIGSLVGIAIAAWTPMTKMPERTALSHAFGALAAALVGIAEYYHGHDLNTVRMTAIGSEVMLGSLTFTGSMMAFGKLQGILPGAPWTYKGQNIFNVSLLLVILLIVITLIFYPSASFLFYIGLILALTFGVMLILPIGAADMPTVISILNSYAGISAALLGFALDNKILIIAGAIDGASGFILSIIMCRAMNRSFTNVLFGAFGKVEESGAAAEEEGAKSQTVRSLTPEEAAKEFNGVKSVIVVPGYGMAAAQAQHSVRELAEILRSRGTTVRYAIHPVAGRMPGHMNVLLAEANVPYDVMLDMDDINPDFPEADIALVIGANDVTNPAARHDKASPIYGMPILDVDKAKKVFVIKRSMNPGFAGIENELYFNENTYMVFGDAKTVVSNIVKGLG